MPKSRGGTRASEQQIRLAGDGLGTENRQGQATHCLSEPGGPICHALLVNTGESYRASRICAKLMRMRTVVSASASLLALSSSVNGLPSYPVGDPHSQQHPVWTSSTYLGEIDQRSSCRKP